MKISSSTGVTTNGAGGVAGRQGPAKPAGGASQPASGASVHLSELSTQLVASGAGPDFDHSKVEAIKQAIADGKLAVNAGAVADKLIANALALSNPSVK
jgi:negative regulator of flagellin synthesis FlgM